MRYDTNTHTQAHTQRGSFKSPRWCKQSCKAAPIRKKKKTTLFAYIMVETQTNADEKKQLSRMVKREREEKKKQVREMEGVKGRRRGVHICTPQCTPAFIRKLRTSHSRGICTALDSTTGTSVTAKKGKDTLFRFFFFFARELTLTPRISLFEKYNLRLCPPPSARS